MIEKMLKFCKEEKKIIVDYLNGHKYLSNGKMFMYMDDEAPTWDARGCASGLHLSDYQLECYEVYDIEDGGNVCDISELDPIEKFDYGIKQGKLILNLFRLPDGKIMFVDAKKLEAFDGFGVNKFFYNGCATLYVVVGNFIVGAIEPECMDLDSMDKFANALHGGLIISLAEGFLDAGGQVEMDM